MKKVADLIRADPARSYHAVVARDSAASPAGSYTPDVLTERQLHKYRLRLSAARFTQLRGIEIGEPHFDPFFRGVRLADAEAIAVTNVTNQTRELFAGMGWQRRFARICQGRSS